MKNIIPRALLVLGLLALTACDKAYQDDSKVLAKVNGDVITENAYQNYRHLLQRQQQAPVEDNEQNRKLLLEQMVFNRLMTREAENQSLHLDKDIHYTIEVQRDEIMIGAVARNYLKTNPVSEDDINQRYEKLKLTNEYLVSHILVDNEKLAGEIIAQLKQKASFKSLAAKHSLHEQSKASGGRVDWINPQFMVPSIYQAADALKKPGLIEQPVHSNFGWHVVNVDKVRPAEIPPLEQIKPAIMEQLQREKISELGRYLRKGATIEYLGDKKD